MALALQDLAPAPGQATTQAAPAAPASSAPRAPQGFDLSALLLPGVMVVMVIMMFWTSRSQQKKQKKLLAELKKGDTVLTQSGLRGKLVEMGERYAKVEIAPGTKVDILRTTVLGKDSVETESQLEKR